MFRGDGDDFVVEVDVVGWEVFYDGVDVGFWIVVEGELLWVFGGWGEEVVVLFEWG